MFEMLTLLKFSSLKKLHQILKLDKMKNNDRFVYLLFYSFIWLVLYFMPRTGYHLSGYSSFYPWILLIVYVIALPYLLYVILLKFHIDAKTSSNLGKASILLSILFVLYINHEDNRDLKNNGVDTVGIVIDVQKQKNRRIRGMNRVNVSYSVNGTRYFLNEDIDENKFILKNSKIRIKYLPSNPQISKIE